MDMDCQIMPVMAMSLHLGVRPSRRACRVDQPPPSPCMHVLTTAPRPLPPPPDSRARREDWEM
jgi:hypothetical protein